MKMNQAYQKILNDLDALLKNPAFIEDVKCVRVLNDIPPDGIKRKKDALVYHKGFVVTPDWVKRARLHKSVQRLLHSHSPFATNPNVWEGWVTTLVLYNEIYPEMANFNAQDIFQTVNLGGMLFDEDYSDFREYFFEDLRERLRRNPFAILISPYTTKNDLIDYIDKNYSFVIAPLQTKYKKESVRIGASRTRSATLRERNSFILEKHLEGHSAKKIVALIREKYGKHLDYTYINTIIRRQKQLQSKK